MTRVEYPCTVCAKREHCNTSSNYLRCQLWRKWMHDWWDGLSGAEDRVKYKAWLDLMIQRSTWRKEKQNETD